MDHDMRSAANYESAGTWLALLFAVALVAFWPTYLSLAPSTYSVYTHAHVAMAALWLVLLIVQPVLIRTRHLDWHRRVGRATYFVAPLMVLTMLMLANHRIRIAPSDAYPIQTYVLYLQLSLTVLFAGLYALGVYWRRSAAIHSRLMVCTALTVIDPVVIRLMFWVGPQPTWNYQWFTFALTDVLLGAMIWLDRQHVRGRALLAGIWAAFVFAQVPALFGFTEGPSWQAFARWYASMPLSAGSARP